MSCELSSVDIGLPDIEFGATGSVVACTRVFVLRAGLPVLTVCSPIDELHVMGALCITVPSTVFSSSLVIRMLTLTTISSHLNEVEGSIYSAGKVRYIDVKSELSVLQFEDLVLIPLQQVDPGSDVITILSMSDKPDLDTSVGLSNTVGTGPIIVFNTINGTIPCASRLIRTKGIVPSVSSITILVSICDVSPPPIGVKSDLTLLLLAISSTTAFCETHRNMVLLFVRPDILCNNCSQYN